MELDVNPETLRTTGATITETGRELEPAGASAKLFGMGEHIQLGSGFFASEKAQNILTGDLAPGARTALSDAGGNCMALSSALNILADAYVNGDHEGALEFAFLEAGASMPAGVSGIVDPGETVFGDAGDGGDYAGDGDGAQYNPSNPPPGTSGTTYGYLPQSQQPDVVYDAYGTENAPWTYKDSPGPVMDNPLVDEPGQGPREDGAIWHGQTVTENADGSTTTQHHIEYYDGSASYYTEVQQADGTVETGNEYSVPTGNENPGGFTGANQFEPPDLG